MDLNWSVVRVVLLLAAIVLDVLDLLQSGGRSKLGWALLCLIILFLVR